MSKISHVCSFTSPNLYLRNSYTIETATVYSQYNICGVDCNIYRRVGCTRLWQRRQWMLISTQSCKNLAACLFQFCIFNHMCYAKWSIKEKLIPLISLTPIDTTTTPFFTQKAKQSWTHILKITVLCLIKKKIRTNTFTKLCFLPCYNQPHWWGCL